MKQTVSVLYGGVHDLHGNQVREIGNRRKGILHFFVN
jgi:hypothetical protein